MPKRLTTQEFVAKAKDVHGDQYDYSKVTYINQDTKVEIICPVHGSFMQRPTQHIRMRQGCPLCGIAKRVNPRTITKTEFIKQAINIYGDRYDYSLIDYKGKHTKIAICCKIHGVFYHSPSNHLNGCGCPKCKSEKRKKIIHGVGVNDLLDVGNTTIFKLWHSMLTRCYADYAPRKFPSYIDCSVCEEWLTFSNFKKWVESPESNYREGYQLDKDILIQGNREYSPNACCFVPLELNTLITIHKNTCSDTPVGVNRFRDKYVARVSGVGYLGIYDTPEDAFSAYKTAKEQRIKQVATDYFNRGEINKEVYEALMRYSVCS